MKKMAILGCGNMSQALLKGYERFPQHKSAYQFFFYNPTSAKAHVLKDLIGGIVVDEINQLPCCDFYLISCKPQHFMSLALDLKKNIGRDAHVISLMAGISLPFLCQSLGIAQATRAMPNIACEIGQGLTLLLQTANTSTEIKTEIASFFKTGSQIFYVADEDSLNYLSAITCLAPAYLYEMCAELLKCTEKKEENKSHAFSMVLQSIVGSAQLMQDKKISPQELTAKVASKGGMTLAALEEWKKRGFSQMVEAGVEKAYERAKNLGDPPVSR